MYISGRPEYRASDPMDPYECIDRLRIGADAPPFVLERSSLTMLSASDNLPLKLVDVKVPQIPWIGKTPTVLIFDCSKYYASFVLELGCCSHTPSADDKLGARYCMERFYQERKDIDRTVGHDCNSDHVVLNEDGQSRVVVRALKEKFGHWEEHPEITLLFKRSRLYSGGKTWEVSVESISGGYDLAESDESDELDESDEF